MKLVIQIPCLNEAEHIAATIADLPTNIPGVDEINILIIDDGSEDDTSGVAKKAGAHKIVRFRRRQGLATAFKTGLDISLAMGADLIVNTDADNQYKGSDIPRLIQPILEGKADMVVGTRNIEAIKEFSLMKKLLQRLGSAVMRFVSQTAVPDATSGFRAYNRRAALSLNVISLFTYTLETIIQAGKKNLAIEYVSVEVNPRRRKSRLFRSTPIYLKRSLATIMRIFVTYEPLRVFFYIGVFFFVLGLILGFRFLYFFFTIPGQTGHIQSLILMMVLLFLGFWLFLIGLLSDLISANRRLIEDAVIRLKRLELQFETRDKVQNGTETVI